MKKTEREKHAMAFFAKEVEKIETMVTSINAKVADQLPPPPPEPPSTPPTGKVSAVYFKPSTKVTLASILKGI